MDVEEVLSQGAYMLLYSRRTPRKGPYVKPTEPAKKKHMASRDTDLCSAPKGEIMSNNFASFPYYIGSGSNSDLLSLTSNTASPSDLSLRRDTGHDRLTDTKADTLKALDILGLEASAEVNLMLSDKDSGISSLGAEVCEGECSSRASHIQEDTAAGVSETDSDSSSLTTSPNVEVREMGFKEPRYCQEASSKENAVAVSDANLASVTTQSSDDSECKSESNATNGVDKQAKDVSWSSGSLKSSPPVSENGSIGKPKPIFSRGFLDGGPRIQTVKQKDSTACIANGYSNGQGELKKGTSFVRRGFLNGPCRRSKSEGEVTNGLANGTASTTTVASGENSGKDEHMKVSNGE